MSHEIWVKNKIIESNLGTEADFEFYCICGTSYLSAKAAILVYRNSGLTTKNTMHEIFIADQKGLALRITKDVWFSDTKPQSLLTVPVPL